MGKFKVDSGVIERELMHSGLYTDCRVSKNKGIKAVVVRNGLICEYNGWYNSFKDYDTQEKLDEFIKKIIEELAEDGS